MTVVAAGAGAGVPGRPALPESSEPRHQHALAKLYYTRSSAFGYRHVLPDCAAFAALVWGLGVAPLPVKFLLALGLGVVTYRMTFIIHDTSHGTLFSRRLENEVVGWTVSSLLLTSFPIYRRLHWIHHLHYRRPDDPQGVDYNGLMPGRDRVVRHLLAPLFLLNVIDKIGHFFALQHCGMTAEERRTAQSDTNAESAHERLASIGAILVAQAAIATLATAGWRYWPGYLFYLAPLPTIGLFLSRLRSYLEHGNLDNSDERRLVARTHRSNPIERNVLSSLLFNYHNEHHRWPQAPSRWLPTIHREVTSRDLPAGDFSRSYAESLRRLRESCRAGAPRD